MVTEKNKEVQHDFFKDGIRLRRDGDWLKVLTYFSSPSLLSQSHKSEPKTFDEEAVWLKLEQWPVPCCSLVH